MAWQDMDDPTLNKSLLKVLDKVINGMDSVYQRYNIVTFGVLQRKLKELQKKYSEELRQEEQESGADLNPKNGPNYIPSFYAKRAVALKPLEADEKYVYVRLYHRNMDKFLDPIWQDNWLRPLLESVRNAQRHGLAVYAQEEEVIRATKSLHYAYVTVLINKNQDITDARPRRFDHDVGVPLLVIQSVLEKNILSFHYQGQKFMLKNGKSIVKL